MDNKPGGPRQPPDKRTAAYESIFGRPGVVHHQSPTPPIPNYPPRHYPNAYAGNGSNTQHLPQPQQYQQQNPQFQPQTDRRTSFASTYAQSVHSIPYSSQPQGNYRKPTAQPAPQPGYASGHSQQPFPQQQYNPYQHPAYLQSGSLGLPPAPVRARSVASVPYAAPSVEAVREEDPSLAAFERTGLTPAQAYQQQVYMNSPIGQQQQKQLQENRTFHYSPQSSQSHGSHEPQNGSASHAPKVNLELDMNGDFGLSFALDTSSSVTEEPTTREMQRHSSTDSVHSATSTGYDISPAHPSSRPYPLQLDTAIMSAQAAGKAVNTSPSSSVIIDMPGFGTSGRRSSESSKTLPGQFRRERTGQDRVRSMSATVSPQARSVVGARPPVPPLPGDVGSPRSSVGATAPRRTPIVYPALLSRVAEAFRSRIQLSDQVKDGLTYKDAFDGREAVDKIAYIIKTTDRNLALLLGRALDAQKYFHAVTYDHRLRDNANDLYQFRTKLPSPFVSGELSNVEEEGVATKTVAEPLLNQGTVRIAASVLTSHDSPTPSGESESGQGDAASTRTSSPTLIGSAHTRPRNGSVSSDDVPLPTGVFTLLTDCYSPTCSRDQLCYSIACPRRLEQQARLNMKPQPGLKKQISKESLGELVEPGTLWIHSVPQEIVNSVSDREKKRQEAINEVIYTERDFVRDMEYLRDLWIKPLKDSDIIPEDRRTDFLEQVFWNIHDIIAVNIRLRDALNKRQKSYAVVEQIGDILLDAVPHYAPFVSYGAHQLYGKYEFEKEKSSNSAFAQFVEETERRPESRKLELNGYLTKPTTRLARYPLLLEAVLKHTPDDNPDKVALPKAVVMVREFLRAVNTESGKTENRFNLLQLDQSLVFRPGEQVDLRLREEGREMLYKGPLKKRGGSQGDSGELIVFLFDHALLMVKQKSKPEQHKVYRRPIPLELLLISAPDDYAVKPSNRQRQMLMRNMPHTPPVPPKDSKGGFSITVVHLGRKYYQMTLWASTYVSQRKWVEAITKQQENMKQRSMVFETATICEGFFIAVNRVNCAAPFYGGRKVVYGTDDGVYLSDFRERNRDPVKVLGLKDVLQVDVLEDYQLLVVLSERQVITFPLDALDPMDPMAGLKRAKRIASHITFFKTGVCLGKTLVCVVKASPLSSTIKTLEPIDQNIRGRNKPTFRKLLQGGNDTLRVFKEFYIPLQSSSIHFLKTKLCVGCPNGFEIVDLETLDTQGLLDPADESLDFIRRRENGLKPMAIYRIDNEFLLCYDEFAFYVNKTGWRSRKEFMVYWEGSPTGFALHYPYVLAFEPTFVEIRHVETGSMSQIIQGNNLRCLFADTPPSTTNGSNQMNYNPYQQPQFGYNPYGTAAASPSTYGGQGAGGSMYGGGYGGPLSQPNSFHQTNSLLRDEILMASDDRVMRVQLAQQPATQY